MKYLCITIFILVSLACTAQSNLPAIATQTATEISVTTSPTLEIVQVNGSWNFRTSPGESSPLIDTLIDVEVTLYDCKDTPDGGVWCLVEYQGVNGWMNKRGLKFSPLTGIK